MALRVTLAYIYAGLTVIQGINTVGHVSIEVGRTVSIPCQYEDYYKNNVKYLCRGSVWKDCSYEIKTNQDNSAKYKILDDKTKGIVTFTFNNPQLKDSDFYWCTIDKTGTDDGIQFKLTVTSGQSALHVDSQWISGYIGGDITIYCRGTGDGIKQWCRIGSGCIENGMIGPTFVSTNTSMPGEYVVTMRRLDTYNIGWYWCAFGDLQMPVFLEVTERPTTTTTLATTTTTLSTATMDLTTVKAIHTSGRKSLPDYLVGAIIALGVLIVIVVVSLVIWFLLRRVKTEESPPQPCGDEPLYSTVIKRPTSHQNPCADKEMEIMYSTVSFIRNTASSKVKIEDTDVVYSTLSRYQ